MLVLMWTAATVLIPSGWKSMAKISELRQTNERTKKIFNSIEYVWMRALGPLESRSFKRLLLQKVQQ